MKYKLDASIIPAPTKLEGACVVLENHLDGAMADMENGEVENYEFILDCIMGLKVLGDTSYSDYLDRLEKYKEGAENGF